jgi:hypothetical protein
MKLLNLLKNSWSAIEPLVRIIIFLVIFFGIVTLVSPVDTTCGWWLSSEERHRCQTQGLLIFIGFFTVMYWVLKILMAGGNEKQPKL